MSARLQHAAAALAGLALTAGLLLYLLARPDSVFALDHGVAFVSATGPLPSFVHTLAFGLLCACAGRTRQQALGLACAWGAIELLAELSQHQAFPALPGWLGDYQQHSTFAIHDLGAVAVATASIVALGLLTRKEFDL